MNLNFLLPRLREHYQLRQWLQLLELAAGLGQSELESNSEALFFIASAHRYLGQPELGLDAYRKALLLDSTSAGLRIEAASALQELEYWSEAQSLLDGVNGDHPEQSTLVRILRLRNLIYLADPCAVEQHLLTSSIANEGHLIAVGIALAEVNFSLGNFDAAEQCLARLFEAAPDHPRAFILRLRLIPRDFSRGAISDAISNILNSCKYHRLVGIEAAKTYERSQLLDEALIAYQALIQRYGLVGLLADAYLQFLAKHGFVDELRAAIALCPSHVTISFQLLMAQCCLEAGQLADSSAHLELCPDDDRRLLLQAQLSKRSGRSMEALRLLKQLNSRHPNNSNIAYDLSLQLLSAGDWSAAWPCYEQRFYMSNSSDCVPAGIRPANSRLHPFNRDVLVFGEQGIGDTVMMASILPDLLDSAASVVLFVQPRLAQLFSHSFPPLHVISTISEDQFLKFDSCYGIGTLASHFRPTPSSCPGSSYLTVDGACIDAWKAKLDQFSCGLNIGIAWRGGPPGWNGQRRSMALEHLLPVLNLEGLNWFSLQNGHDPQELHQLEDRHGIVITHFPGVADDIYQTAGLISALDLVVTVQQSALHLAGSLGQVAWVLLPADAEWRYGSQGAKMPWYNSVELFRQSSAGDWSGVIDSVRQRLISWLAEVAGQNEGQQLS